MGGVSMEWKVFSLSDIAHYSQGKQIPLNLQYLELNELRERFIRIVDFTSNWSQEPRFVDKDPKYLVNIDDIVMIRYGTPGKVFRGHKGIIANNLFKITFNEEIIDKDYAYWYLNQDSVYKQLMAGQSSSTMPAITFGMLKYIMVRVPPISYQRRIASILSSLDRKIELNNKINADLEEMAQAIFKNWFVDFEPFKDGKFVDSELGMIPEGWKVGGLFDIAEIFDKKRKPLSGNVREKMDKIYPYYGATSCMDYVDDYIFDGIYTLIGEDGSVVKENGLPYMQYVWGKMWVNNHAHILQGKNSYSTEMIHALLSITNIKFLVTGAVQAKLSQGNMQKILVAIPPKNVLDEIRPVIDNLYSKIRINTDENSRLSLLRDTLLPRLMSGELEVPE